MAVMSRKFMGVGNVVWGDSGVSGGGNQAEGCFFDVEMEW